MNVVRYRRDEDANPVIGMKLREIAEFAVPGERRKVFILGRYKHLCPSKLPEWKRQFSKSLIIDFMTMHGAKGLEADYVIVLGMNTGLWGFSSEVDDDPILNLVMSVPEKFEFAEERRLFYVALTRAKHKVYLLSKQNSPSQFVEEIIRDKSGAVLDEVADKFGRTISANQMSQVRGRVYSGAHGSIQPILWLLNISLLQLHTEFERTRMANSDKRRLNFALMQNLLVVGDFPQGFFAAARVFAISSSP